MVCLCFSQILCEIMTYLKLVQRRNSSKHDRIQQVDGARYVAWLSNFDMLTHAMGR